MITIPRISVVAVGLLPSSKLTSHQPELTAYLLLMILFFSVGGVLLFVPDVLHVLH